MKQWGRHPHPTGPMSLSEATTQPNPAGTLPRANHNSSKCKWDTLLQVQTCTKPCTHVWIKWKRAGADKTFVTSARPKSHSVPHAWSTFGDTGQRPVQPERWWRVQQRPSSTTVSSLFSLLDRTSLRLPCPRRHMCAPGSSVSTEHGQPGTMSPLKALAWGG